MSYFANKTSNRDPESIEKQAVILFELYSSNGSLASIESKFEDGKVVSRIISRRTVFYLTWVYIIPGIITLFFPLNYSFVIYIFYLFLTIPIWILLPGRIVPSLDDQEIINWIKKNLLKEKRNKRFKVWKYLVTISPFSLRTIWMWVIIFGMYTAYREAGLYINPIPDYTGNFSILDYSKINTFALSFLKTMIVAIISYIATNIISDLIDLKEEYVKGKKKINELVNEIGASANVLKKDISESNEIIKNSTSELKIQKFFAPLQREYDNFQQVNGFKYKIPNNNLIKSFEKYSEFLANQIGIVSKRLTGNPVIDLWLLTGLKSAAELRVSQIEDQNSIITLFEVFGNIIADCLDNFDSNNEDNSTDIYTVFSLPPDRFLNYNGYDPLSNYWERYLETNKKAASRKIKVHRHYLSFTNCRDTTIRFAGAEGMDLMDAETLAKWKKEYWINPDGTPYFSIDKARYQKSDEIPDNPSLTLKPLYQIVESTYHCPNCCKLLKVDLEKNWEDIFYSKIHKKPIDYFALKSSSRGEWIFCFKTYYDKGLNAAIVELWHENDGKLAEWENIKKELDRLFTHNPSKGIEIVNILNIN